MDTTRMVIASVPSARGRLGPNEPCTGRCPGEKPGPIKPAFVRLRDGPRLRAGEAVLLYAGTNRSDEAIRPWLPQRVS
jgi:hypothetical protein